MLGSRQTWRGLLAGFLGATLIFGLGACAPGKKKKIVYIPANASSPAGQGGAAAPSATASPSTPAGSTTWNTNNPGSTTGTGTTIAPPALPSPSTIPTSPTPTTTAPSSTNTQPPATNTPTTPTTTTQPPVATTTPTTTVPPATAAPPTLELEAWFPYYFKTDAQASLTRELPRLKIVSPFWYKAQADGSIKDHYGAGDPAIISQIQSSGARCYPTIERQFDFNDPNNPIDNPTIRQIFVIQCQILVLSNRYDGLELDFHTLAGPATQTANFTTLVQDLANGLHNYGAQLIVTVMPRVSATSGWKVYDYAGLGKAADRLRIMMFNEHYAGGAPGPIASLGWSERVLDYALTVVDKRKIVMAIPFHGFDWGIGQGNAQGLTHKGATALAAAKGITPSYDAASGEATFKYAEAGVQHEVWFQHAQGMAERSKLAARKGILGICPWHLGQESPDYWTRLEKP